MLLNLEITDVLTRMKTFDDRSSVHQVTCTYRAHQERIDMVQLNSTLHFIFFFICNYLFVLKKKRKEIG